MNRVKTILWMLAIIVVIGIVAIFARTPDRGATATSTPAGETTLPGDTAADDTAAGEGAEPSADGTGAPPSDQSSSQ